MKLSEAEKYLKPDSIWSAWNIESQKQFIEKMVPEIIFRKEVAEDVLKEFETIKSLMIHSYYKYQFYDMAVNRSLQILEMACKIRYKELNGVDWKIGKSFEKLIKEFDAINMFDTHVSIIHHLREIRNSLLHPDRHSYAGVVMADKILFVVQLINEIYDNVELRKKRIELQKQFNDFYLKNLESINEIVLGKKTTLLYKMQLLLIDTKDAIPLYHLIGIPLFPLESYIPKKDGGTLTPRFNYFLLTNVVFENGEIKGYDLESKSDTIIRKSISPAGIKKHSAWAASFTKIDKMHAFNITSGISGHMGGIYSHILRNYLLK